MAPADVGLRRGVDEARVDRVLGDAAEILVAEAEIVAADLELVREVDGEQPGVVRVDRDEFMEVAQRWDIFGIPSFVVTENGKEIGRLVNKLRKTRAEINSFLAELK